MKKLAACLVAAMLVLGCSTSLQAMERLGDVAAPGVPLVQIGSKPGPRPGGGVGGPRTARDSEPKSAPPSAGNPAPPPAIGGSRATNPQAERDRREREIEMKQRKR